MSKHTYEVVVGNVGTVYSGPSIDEASKQYVADTSRSKHRRQG